MTELVLNSCIYTHLRKLIETLPQDAISKASKHLLEAVSVALAKGEKHEYLAKRIRRERQGKQTYTLSLSAEKAESDIAEIKQLRKIYHRNPLIPGAKKLERYHSEVLTLHRHGASLRDIKFWLLSHKKVVVSHHSIQRYIHAILNRENNDQSIK